MKFLTIRDDTEILTLRVSYLKKWFAGLSLYKNKVVLYVDDGDGNSKYLLLFEKESDAEVLYKDLLIKFDQIID